MSRLTRFKDSVLEILLIAKTVLTTFWFWLPALFAAYMYFQLWIVFFVHPLTILIVPVVVALFAMVWEEQRVEAQYGLERVKMVRASDPLGSLPVWERVRLDVEKALREYRELKEDDRKAQKE